MATDNRLPLPEAQMGPAEKLLDLILNASAHLWHNRPGLDVGGTWYPAKGKQKMPPGGKPVPVRPGLHVPAAERLYARLLDIYKLNTDLMAHFASYALTETDWRDLKVACAALMLVQSRSGQPVKEDDGTVGFYDDDLRALGEAMMLHYAKKSTRMMTPKSILRIAELLETPSIAALNRRAGFGDPSSKRPPLGRWKRAATKWLRVRETNIPMLHGLAKAGYKETIKQAARKSGYKPESQAFFEVLGWKQKQSKGGHRTVGLSGLKLEKSNRFDGLSEAEICEMIETQRLSYKEAVGRLPKGMGLTPAILAVLVPSLSDRDLRMLTPTLEELGLMAEPDIRARWEKAVASADDMRALHIAKNVKTKAIREKLEEAADAAAKRAVAEATKEADVRVMVLIDKSGSMTSAIEKSKEVLTRILAGFPAEKVHIATFDTVGTVLKPKAATRMAVQHMLKGIAAGGGTVHGAGLHAFHSTGVTIPDGAKLIVIVVGDEAGETGKSFADAFSRYGYRPDAIALLLSVANATQQGTTVRACATELALPFSTVDVEQFDDPYQVTRVLTALLEAPRATGTRTSGWVEKVMRTKLLTEHS
jgi:hypothetical protein